MSHQDSHMQGPNQCSLQRWKFILELSFPRIHSVHKRKLVKLSFSNCSRISRQAAVPTLTRAVHLLNSTALKFFLRHPSPVLKKNPHTLHFLTSSVPTPPWNKCHQKCWMNVIYTSWFLRGSFRTALLIIGRLTIVYYKFFNLHKSLYDGYNPEVHFSILKVIKKFMLLLVSYYLQLFLPFPIFISSCFTCLSRFKEISAISFSYFWKRYNHLSLH